MVLGAELINNPVFAFDSEKNGIQFDVGRAVVRGGMEVKSGKLKLCVSRNRTQQNQQIILKLYAAAPFPFAVVFPDKFICPKHCGLIQLKNFSVEVNGETDFTVIIRNDMEGGKCLKFSANSSEERDSWLNSFQAQSSSCSKNCQNKNKKARRNINSRLPSLEEVSEEVEVQEGVAVLKSCENVLRGNNNNNNNTRKRSLTPRRRVVEVPLLEQISEEDEDTDNEMDFENRINSNSRRRSSLKDMTSRGGRSL